MEKAYSKTLQEVATQLQVDLESGLSSSEAAQRLLKYGPNSLKEKKSKNPLTLFLSEFTDFLVIILLVAAAVSFALGEKIDAIMIMAIVILNAVVGFIQEYKVEKAIEHLKKLVSQEALVIRDGQIKKVDAKGLVPGDLIQIEEGQKLAADIRLTQVINLKTIEASLTGESTPVSKQVDALLGDVIVADQKNMLFSGTSVSAGKGMGIVVATAMNTQIGKIAKLVEEEKSPEAPMQIKLNKLGKLIGKIILVISALVAAQEFIFGGQQIIEALISAVALAVAAIPEGLPAVVTISLALGTRRLLAQKALIRNLPAAETLGSTDVICSDKTGTLTQGTMSVTKIYSYNEPKVLEMSVLASNARLSDGKIIGDTTEAALIQKAQDSGIGQAELLAKYPRVLEIPFSSDRKMMTTINKNDSPASGKTNFYVTSKGAPEVILSHCTQIEKDGKVAKLTDDDKSEILKINEEMAGQALRVLAFAYKATSQANEKDAESNLVFLGLVGMMDPPRKEVRQAIETCQNEAGIRVIMITGDHLLTACAIAREVGIKGQAISGLDLDKMSDEEFTKKVSEISIYARVNPEHKLKIVKALKANGHQVAMTGDGVNDAPALKASDIGVAMGITGTDVAKDSSDMILLDDHFKTIVAAVSEGRAIYDNIRKFVNYLLSSNMMEVGVIFVAIALGWAIPLLPLHLLWINLVTDGLPAIALGVDPARPNIMKYSPKIFSEQIITRKFFGKMLTASFLITLAVLFVFGSSRQDLARAQSMAFCAMVLYEMIRLVDIRAEYGLPLFSNKYLNLAVFASLALQLMLLYLPISFLGISLQNLLKVTPLKLTDWFIILGVGIVLLALMRFIERVSDPLLEPVGERH